MNANHGVEEWTARSLKLDRGCVIELPFEVERLSKKRFVVRADGLDRQWPEKFTLVNGRPGFIRAQGGETFHGPGYGATTFARFLRIECHCIGALVRRPGWGSVTTYTFVGRPAGPREEVNPK